MLDSTDTTVSAKEPRDNGLPYRPLYRLGEGLLLWKPLESPHARLRWLPDSEIYSWPTTRGWRLPVLRFCDKCGVMPIFSALSEHVVEIACPKCGFVIEWGDPNITPTSFHFYEDVLRLVVQKWNDNDARVLALPSK